MSQWEIASTTPSLHSLRALWFKSSTKLGLVFGAHRPLNKLLGTSAEERAFAKEAFILRCQDDLNQWTSVYHGNGEILRACWAGSSTFYAVGRRSICTSTHPERFMLKSVNMGLHWTEVPSIPSTSITGLAFISPDIGYAWSSSDLFTTHDGARTWSTFHDFMSGYAPSPEPAMDTDGNLCVIRDNTLTWIDALGRTHDKALPFRFDTKFLSARGPEEVLLLGNAVEYSSSLDGLILISADGHVGVRSLVTQIGFIPNFFQALGSSIVILGTRVTHSSIEQVEVLSHDHGHTWSEEIGQGPITNVAFLEDEQHLWASSTMDRILRRSLA